MSINRTFRGAPSRALLLASAAALLATPVLAQTINEVSGVTITGQASYKTNAITSATKTPTALIDVPQAVNVVSVKQIEDQAANGIGDAVRYVPGVFSSQGCGGFSGFVEKFFRGAGEANGAACATCSS